MVDHVTLHYRPSDDCSLDEYLKPEDGENTIPESVGLNRGEMVRLLCEQFTQEQSRFNRGDRGVNGRVTGPFMTLERWLSTVSHPRTLGGLDAKRPAQPKKNPLAEEDLDLDVKLD